LFKIKYQAKQAKKLRKYSIWGIKIIGPWRLDPLVICHAKKTQITFTKAKKKLFGRRKVRHFSITTTSQITAAPLSTPMKAQSIHNI